MSTGLVRVRSPLLTESRLMSFPPGTEMFQFSGFASPKLCIHLGDDFSPITQPVGPTSRIIGEAGLPHSEIVGSMPAHGSPTLIAACHVLHRLYMPRHPPVALTSRLRVHTTNNNAGSITRPKLGRAAKCSLLGTHQSNTLMGPFGVDDNLSLAEHATIEANLDHRCPCSADNQLQPESRNRMPPRHRFEKPIHNVKKGGPWTANRALHPDLVSSSNWIVVRLVEPIGIEPMT
jgi:hypothetical protein